MPSNSHPLRRRSLLFALPGACLPGVPWAQGAGRAPGEVLVGGTGAGLGVVQRIAMAESKLRVVPNLGTSGGLKALAAGAIDIALSARRLTDEERARGLVDHEFFRTPFVWAVHAGVPLERTTLRELAELYAGRPAQWGSGLPVRLVLRPETDSDTRAVKALGPEFVSALALAHARPGVQLSITDGEALADIERIAGAIGVTNLGLIKAEQRRVRELTLDGVAPSLEAMVAGRYKLSRSVVLVTRSAPTPAAAQAAKWLVSREATQALAALSCQALHAAA